MALPLYREARTGQPNYSAGCNSGLWYDKFFDKYQSNWSVGTEKNSWIEGVCGRPVGDAALLEYAVTRLGWMVLALGGTTRHFATEWRFVTGLGRDHPVENGFAWHHTLGVPFLPGSSVKGLTRDWAAFWAGVEDGTINRVFGPKGEREDRCAGSVIFFDALPTKPVKLAPDVMTPHYAPYYKPGSDRPPGDWYAPVPVPFLTVVPGQVFLFALAPRRPSDEASRADCLLALQWLEEALAQIGAGAKTAVGYGRFTRRADKEEAFLAQIKPAAPEESVTPEHPESPVLVEMRQDGFGTDENRFMASMTSKWLPRLQAEGASADEKAEIALLLKEWYLRYRSDQWRKPNKKNAAKIAEIKKYLKE